MAGDFAHRQPGGLGQEFGKRAMAHRVEMLHQHKPHPSIERQMPEQLRECLQPTRRRADPDDGKRSRRARRVHSGLCSMTFPARVRWLWLSRSGSSARRDDFARASIPVIALVHFTRQACGRTFPEYVEINTTAGR